MSNIDIAYYVASYGGAICIGLLSRSIWIAIIGAIAWSSIVLLIAAGVS